MAPLDEVEFLIHTPPGSGPQAMLESFFAAAEETGEPTQGWSSSFCNGGHGLDAMRALVERHGDTRVVSTCTPSFLQVPLLEGLSISYTELTPLACLMLDPYLLVVSAESKTPALDVFLSHLNARPTTTGGYMVGGINHMVALQIASRKACDVRFEKLDSAADLVPALRAGRLDWAVGTPVEVRTAIESGAVRPLAALAPVRLAEFPSVPTLAEAGMDIRASVWRGLIGPGGLPDGIVSAWDKLCANVVASPAWAEFIGSKQVPYLDSHAFRTFLDEEENGLETELGRAGLVRSK
jgi:putative tricarboxylic transport membrane protein